MPLFKMKKVWDYCTYNKAFFLLILILFGILICIDAYFDDVDGLTMFILISLTNILIWGYGMSIARDRINEGFRLPKILIKDVFIFGIQASIVTMVYAYLQEFILYFISAPLDFPEFDLEELLLELPHTIHMLFSHNPLDALIFLVFGAIIFYITAFFMEIALARLADTGSIISALNIFEIKRDIDLIGWRHYANEYTQMILAVVIFSYFAYIDIPIDILNIIWPIVWTLFAFATQFMGIGAIYSEVKKKKSQSE